MALWIDLNKTPIWIRMILDILVIILLLTASFFLYRETYYVKKYGGQCINDPMGWAEWFAYTEKGEVINCHCEQVINYGFNFIKNITINNSEGG